VTTKIVGCRCDENGRGASWPYIHSQRELSCTSVDYNLPAYPLISSEQSSIILGNLVLLRLSYCRRFRMSGARNKRSPTYIRAYVAANSNVSLFCIWTGSFLLIPFTRPIAGRLKGATAVWPRAYFRTPQGISIPHKPSIFKLILK
jgi:hypothetical protein